MSGCLAARAVTVARVRTCLRYDRRPIPSSGTSSRRWAFAHRAESCGARGSHRLFRHSRREDAPGRHVCGLVETWATERLARMDTHVVAAER